MKNGVGLISEMVGRLEGVKWIKDQTESVAVRSEFSEWPSLLPVRVERFLVVL
jgi:hypothetical protein